MTLIKFLLTDIQNFKNRTHLDEDCNPSAFLPIKRFGSVWVVEDKGYLKSLGFPSVLK